VVAKYQGRNSNKNFKIFFEIWTFNSFIFDGNKLG
jgi:hypothetical protein